jgi:hypothetical protein
MLNRDLTFWDDFVGQLMQIHNTLLYYLYVLFIYCQKKMNRTCSLLEVIRSNPPANIPG